MTAPSFLSNLGYGPSLSGGPVTTVAGLTGPSGYATSLYSAAPGVILSAPAAIPLKVPTNYPILYVSCWIANPQPGTVIFQIDSPMSAGVCIDPNGILVQWYVNPIGPQLEFWGTNILAGVNEYFFAIGEDEGQSWTNGVGGNANSAGVVTFVPPVMAGGADWQIIPNGSYLAEIWADVPPPNYGVGSPAGFLAGAGPAYLGGVGQLPGGMQPMAYFGGVPAPAVRTMQLTPLLRQTPDNNARGLR